MSTVISVLANVALVPVADAIARLKAKLAEIPNVSKASGPDTDHCWQPD